MDRAPEYYGNESVVSGGGSIQPPEDYHNMCSGISVLSGATTQDSFQTRLEIILQNKGIEILQDADETIRLFQDSDTDRKTMNVFRTILMTGAVTCFVSYVQEQMQETELVRRCNELLQDEWGMSPAAFRPVIKQTLNAIDKAIQSRRDSVGKTICNQLKEMRRRFAAANQIEYYEEDCTEAKPCEGTCPYCEERTKYLVNEAKKIATIREVIYPQIAENEMHKDYQSYGGSGLQVGGQTEVFSACGDASGVTVPLDTQIFHLSGKKAMAKGYINKVGFVVLKGSQMYPVLRKSCGKWIKDLREELVESGKVRENVFRENVTFSSPSAAAASILGGETNGWIAWKDEDGTSLKELKASDDGVND